MEIEWAENQPKEDTNTRNSITDCSISNIKKEDTQQADDSVIIMDESKTADGGPQPGTGDGDGNSQGREMPPAKRKPAERD